MKTKNLPTNIKQVRVKRADRDWVGHWYAIAREERGVNDMIGLARYDLRTGDMQMREVSHEKMDGLGALVHLLRSDGHAAPYVPQGRVKAPSSLAERWQFFRNFLKASKNRTMDWKVWNPDAKFAASPMVWHVLTREETTALNARCKKEGFSQNALLMSHLSRVLGQSLVKPGKSFPWLFPVNMRGAVNLKDSLANHSSAVGIECHAEVKPSEVHSEIRTQLKSGTHWGTWWTLNIGKIVGRHGMRWLSHMRAEKNHWMGTFSHLGAWPYSSGEASGTWGDPNVAWMPGPPGTLNFPVGFACMEWFGRLCYTLKIHPAICPEGVERVGSLEKKFRESVLAFATSENQSIPEAVRLPL